MSIKISVICVYNNKNQFEMQLKQSLYDQNVEYELVELDNENGRFSSAAEALNYGAKLAQGDVLIFSHQDIYFKESDGLSKLSKAIEECGKGSIVGTQGVSDGSMIYYTNLTSGNRLEKRMIRDFDEAPIEVSCIDEGLFGMMKSTYQVHPFDEELCDNWHLYAVEQCLWARKNGNHVYSYPLQIHHFSRGHISRSYMKGLIKIAKYYRKSNKYIWTTCYKVKTTKSYLYLLYFCWCSYRIIRGKVLD